MMNKAEIFWDKRASNFEKKPIKTVQNANFELISLEKPDPKSVYCFLVAKKL
jgi:hypothetical protein